MPPLRLAFYALRPKGSGEARPDELAGTVAYAAALRIARFDLASGGTLDLFADDVRVFPVEVRDGEVWVDLRPKVDRLDHQRQRLRDGLERNISLVIAKAIIALLDGGGASGGTLALHRFLQGHSLLQLPLLPLVRLELLELGDVRLQPSELFIDGFGNRRN